MKTLQILFIVFFLIHVYGLIYSPMAYVIGVIFTLIFAAAYDYCNIRKRRLSKSKTYIEES